MRITRLFAAAAVLFLSAQFALALTTDDGTIKSKNIFGIEFPDGNSFFGVADHISNISKQTYIAGPLSVTEVSINLLAGTVQLRIYNARQIDSKGIGEQLAEKLPDNLKPYATMPNTIQQNSPIASQAEEKIANALNQPLVVKDYPATTHAKTLEYIIPDLEELENFYNKLVSDYIGTAYGGNGDNSALPSTGMKIHGRIYKFDKQQNTSSGAGGPLMQNTPPTVK